MDEQAMDGLMRRLAERQHGLVGRDQLRGRGISRHSVCCRLRSPDWMPVTSRVLRLVGMPESDEQRAVAAVLDAGEGSVLSHRSAAALWGLPGFDLRDLEVSRPRTGANRTTTLAKLHHPRFLPAHHCTEARGIPVTTLVRTIFDLAGSEHPGRAERAFHAALKRGLSWPTIEGHLSEVAERGRVGIALMRELVEDNREKPALDSGLEARFLSILRRAGLPEPRRQVDVGDAQWVGRVDFLYEELHLVLEVNGAWHHSGALEVQRDQHRTARLVAAGFTVLPIPEHLILSAPYEVVRLVREARGRAA
jgi:very-short-patch-repair endonuclease